MPNGKRFTWMTPFILALTAGLSFAPPVVSEGDEIKPPKVSEPLEHLFGNTVCPVSGDPVHPEYFVSFQDEENSVHGRVYLCCEECAAKAEENIERLYHNLYRKDPKTGKPRDVLDLENTGCAMSGEPIVPGLEFEYNGMLVHFCCPGCAQDFLDVPNEQLVNLVPDLEPHAYTPPEKRPAPAKKAPEPKEEKQAGKDRKLTHLFANHECPVMGGAVDPDSFVEYRNPEERLYGRVYMCCDGCDGQVEKEIADLYKKFYRTDAETAQEADPVDLENATCPMSGGPVVAGLEFEYNGMIVHFCCTGCGQEFLDAPDEKLVEFAPNLEEYVYERPAGSGSSR